MNFFEYDCLRHYHKTSEINIHLIPSLHSRVEIIEYCLRPTNEKQVNLNFINTRDENYTFDQLYYLNISEDELISVSTTIDLIEKYQDFLNNKDKNSLLSKNLFYKCKEPWFGNRCEYSFELYNSDDWLSIASDPFQFKNQYKSNINRIERTCYINIKCNRGGLAICLDWREICNGHIDCFDDGEDEKECFQLELNECSSNEYRCLNGLCISKYLSDNEEHLTDCLDRSISIFTKYDSDCFTNPWFVCEEYLCPPNARQFSCGDGECVEYFDECQNGRHYLLIQSLTIQGNLSKQCWLALICLTKIENIIKKNSCKNFSNSSDLLHSFESCDEITEFPQIPVLYGHVTFLYRKQSKTLINISLAYPPDYICYDSQLCDHLQGNFTYKNKTCQMRIQSNVEYFHWKTIIDTIKNYFNGCLGYYKKQNRTNSLYSCVNSSKFISYHRIHDGRSDCYLNDDEQQFELSCSLNDNQRVRCFNENICYSPFFYPKKICPKEIHRKQMYDLIFNQICDGIVHLLPELINGENHTDETECQYWPCSNIYSRCDLFLNCPNGEDEFNCSKSICKNSYHPCISPLNGTFECLSKNRINNQIIDCLGGSDELSYCLQMESLDENSGRYHCFNEDRCIRSDQLCNRKQDCLFADDEAYCHHIRESCEFLSSERTDIEKTLCQLRTLKQMEFSLTKSIVYPSYNFKIRRNIEMIHQQELKLNDFSWTWHCNRGLYARYWLGENNYTFKCFCPPSYFGDRCEYQNDRVSLSLKLLTNHYYGIYILVIFLIDNDENIHSYETIDYSSQIDLFCSNIYDIYLLYFNRTKTIKKIYRIHIDVFDKISLNFISSWYFQIPFVFLPVNRLSFQLYIPTSRMIYSQKCQFKCEHGKCMKYLNIDRMYCRCHSGWSGISCNIHSNCHDCSSDSICLGSISNRSICICPRNRLGSRCLIKVSCPKGFCRNNGQCIVLDENKSADSYICICPKPYYGSQCDIIQAYQLKILLKDIEYTQYVTIYPFSVINNEIISQSLVREKLKIFQNIFVFYHNGDFNIIIIEINNNYYLSSVQPIPRQNYSTSISSNEKCLSINQLLNSTLIHLSKIRQIKYYHQICQNNKNLLCFYDEYYLCLCNREYFANCFHFQSHKQRLKSCRHNFHCFNDGQCLTNNPICPRFTICECIDCYFGERCQFYAKGISLTLDDILRYEIRPNVYLKNQSLSIHITIIITSVMFSLALINSLFSFLVFATKNSMKVGCGIYLLMSSITLFLTITCLTIKLWLLILSQMNSSPNRLILRIECVFMEIFIKLFLYNNNWLNACVALERAITIFQGIHFNRQRSKQIAYCIIIILPCLIFLTILHQYLYRQLFDDIEEERIWCINDYSLSIRNYDKFISFFHFLGPFLLNIFSAFFIIYRTSRHQATIRSQKTFQQHFFNEFKEHKHLIISPILLVTLSIPYLIISLLSSCVKVSHDSFLYISGYFISFIPSVLIFIIFVLPSETYKEQFKKSIKYFQRLMH